MERKLTMIGSSEQVLGGVRYYSGRTEQGIVYKNEKAFIEGGQICYINEHAFTDSEDDFVLLTPDNVVELSHYGSVWTRESIIDEICTALRYANLDADLKKGAKKLKMDEYDFKEGFIEKYLAPYVFDIVDWQCVSTEIEELDLVEELEEYIDRCIREKEVATN